MSHEDTSQKEHLNIVFIGHVDAGKSTISGHLLILTGEVDQRQVELFEQKAKELNRESWGKAFVMDTNEEERAKGKTVEVGEAHFMTTKKRYTLLDAPGHKNYVPNMIGGAALADIGVLVISARRGEFEAGFENGGQTREHVMLARTLGISKLVVLINKMDEESVDWKQARYKQIEKKLTPFLKRWGFRSGDTHFCPCSGFTGQNLLEPVGAIAPWYTGPTFIDLLDSLPPLKRDLTSPVRMPIYLRYKEQGDLCLGGKLAQGQLSVGKYVVMPWRKEFTIKNLQVDGKEATTADAGENILMSVSGDLKDYRIGDVVCAEPVVPTATQFIARVAVTQTLPNNPIITIGYEAQLHIHTLEIECELTELQHLFNKKGQRSRAPPPFLRVGQMAQVLLTTPQPIAVDTHANCAALSRFTIRDEGVTVMCGKVLDLVPIVED